MGQTETIALDDFAEGCAWFESRPKMIAFGVRKFGTRVSKDTMKLLSANLNRQDSHADKELSV